MINPKESRLYDLWQIIMLGCYLLELILIPYVIFVGQESFLCGTDEMKRNMWIVDMVIDALHILNIYVIVCTQIPNDNGMHEHFAPILWSYIR
jgi:hypothetical protein